LRQHGKSWCHDHSVHAFFNHEELEEHEGAGVRLLYLNTLKLEEHEGAGVRLLYLKSGYFSRIWRVSLLILWDALSFSSSRHAE